MAFYTREHLESQIAQHAWEIGEHSYGAPTVHMWGVDGKLKIGKYCSIAGGCEILLGGNHRPDWITTYPFNVLCPESAHIQGHPATKGDVVIGNDVWLGQKCVIMSGITIGSGAVVAAEAVVTKNVPDYAIVGGNPAKVLRCRFSDQQIRSLLRIRWWDWPDEKVKSVHEKLLSTRVDEFISYAESMSSSD